jgi:putative OPT family oligopeptide transporter
MPGARPRGARRADAMPAPGETRLAAPQAKPTGPTPAAPMYGDATNLPEITLVVVVLGIVLAMVMAAANAYLGLFAGITVSAAIPAAVVSMAALTVLQRVFGYRKNILQNNIVHTTASAGESVAAGIIFTVPALLILGVWQSIGVVETMLIAALGGSLGVFFTIPLRRAFIVTAQLQYPEGVATVEVLKSGEKGASGAGYIALAAIAAAAYKFMGAGMHLWSEAAQGARRIGSSLAYFGGTLSPALVGVGYIVGLRIAVLIFLGGMIAWGVGIPAYLAGNPWPTDASGADLGAVDAAFTTWSTQIRYMGVGAMAFGGLYTLVRLRGALAQGIRSGLDAYRAVRAAGTDVRPRTERDITMRTVGIAMLVFVLALSLLYMYYVTGRLEQLGNLWIGLVMAVVMLLAGFLFTAVAGYMAGVVGSSNNPISGVTIATVIFTALLLLGLGLGPDLGPEATIFVAATIASAAAIAGDNMQDLKAGHILGSTPRKLQIMEVVGTMAAALVIPATLILLHQAYGIGIPPPGCEGPDAARTDCSNVLRAPQATLMAAVSQGIFLGGIPWSMFAMGVGIAALIVGADLVLERRRSSFRMPVLAVAVGIYLPLELATPIFLGGLIHWGAKRWTLRQLGDQPPEARAEALERRLNRGILFSSGLIAGEAIIGIAVAGLIVTGIAPRVQYVEQATWWIEGLLVLGFLAYLLFWVTQRRERA